MAGKTMTPAEYAKAKNRARAQEYMREWHDAHPGKRSEYNKRYYEKHREEYLAKQREAYHADIEQSRAYVRQYARSYREKHRDEINAKKRALYAAKKAQQAKEMGGGQ